MSEDWPECVFTEKVKCKVRYEMGRATKLQKWVNPPDDLDEKTIRNMAEILQQTLGVNWQALAMFCTICPKRHFSSVPVGETVK